MSIILLSSFHITLVKTLKQRRSIVSGRWMCLCVSQLGPPPDHPGRRCTRKETHRRFYTSLTHQDHNISTTYTDPSILDHRGPSPNLTTHPSVHHTKPESFKLFNALLFLSCCVITNASVSCVFKQQGSDRQPLQKQLRFHFLFLLPS